MPMMTYFRIPLPSHGTGALAAGHWLCRCPVVAQPSAVPACRQGAVAAGISQGGQVPAPDRLPAATGPGGSPGQLAEGRHCWRTAARFMPARQGGPDWGSAEPLRRWYLLPAGRWLPADHPVLAVAVPPGDRPDSPPVSAASTSGKTASARAFSSSSVSSWAGWGVEGMGAPGLP